MMKNSKRHNSAIIILIICSIILAAYYATAYSGHILWQEQNQIFLNTSSWIAGYFDRPAWLGCLAGEWLTQFYHNVVVGAIIQTLSIAACVATFANVARKVLHRYAAWLLTFIFAILMVGCSFSSATTLSFFVCVAGGLSLGFARIDLRVNSHKFNLSPLIIPFSYWMFGFGGLLTALVIMVFSVKSALGKRKYKSCFVAIAVSTVFALVLPALTAPHYALPYSKALLYPGLAKPSLPQKHMEKRLEIADAFYLHDYEKVRKLALEVKDPDDITAFYFYLANAVNDSLPDYLLKYPVKSLGTLTTIGETTPLPVINMMNDLYFELGDMTYAERAAMMRNVFSPRNRNVRMIKRLAETNLVSGDTAAATKYLRILEKTHYYADWGRKHMPGNTTPEVDAEIFRRRAHSNDKDNIRLGDNCRNIILELLESNPDNKVALDYLLCTDLLLKDMDTFKMDYDTYCMEKGSQRIRDLYQQAMMIYLAGTDAPAGEWDRYIYSPELLQRFRQYSDRRGDPAFKDTYWYYFDKQ